jgi:hypothetical protein
LIDLLFVSAPGNKKPSKRHSSASLPSADGGEAPLGRTASAPLVLHNNQVRCTCGKGSTTSHTEDEERDEATEPEEFEFEPEPKQKSKQEKEFEDRYSRTRQKLHSEPKRAFEDGNARTRHKPEPQPEQESETESEPERVFEDRHPRTYGHKPRTSALFKTFPKNFKPKPTYDHFVFAPVSAPARHKDAPAPTHAPVKGYSTIGPSSSGESHSKKTIAPMSQKHNGGSRRAPAKEPVRAPARAPTKAPVRAPASAPTKAPAQAPVRAPAQSHPERRLEDLEKQYRLNRGDQTSDREVTASILACFGRLLLCPRQCACGGGS